MGRPAGGGTRISIEQAYQGHRRLDRGAPSRHPESSRPRAPTCAAAQAGFDRARPADRRWFVRRTDLSGAGFMQRELERGFCRDPEKAPHTRLGMLAPWSGLQPRCGPVGARTRLVSGRRTSALAWSSRKLKMTTRPGAGPTLEGTGGLSVVAVLGQDNSSPPVSRGREHYVEEPFSYLRYSGRRCTTRSPG